MPKTRDAFALRKYLKTILDPLIEIVNKDYSLDFTDFFSGMFEDGGHFEPVENSVIEIQEIIKCKVHYIKDFEVRLSDVDNAKLVFKKINATISRFDRHIQRLLKFDAKDTRRKDWLIGQYDWASKILENFETALSAHYLKITKIFSKTFARQVGRRIRISRQLKNLSQDTVAKELGVAAITVSTWERGEREPSLYSIRQLAVTLDVSLDFLFGLTDKTIE